jgi:hypothetical protein
VTLSKIDVGTAMTEASMRLHQQRPLLMTGAFDLRKTKLVHRAPEKFRIQKVTMVMMLNLESDETWEIWLDVLNQPHLNNLRADSTWTLHVFI